MNIEEEYRELGERLSKLSHRHAVLVAKEEQKAVERKALEAELTEAGVNVEKLDEEASRLETEVRSEYLKAKASVDVFEVELSLAAEVADQAPNGKEIDI